MEYELLIEHEGVLYMPPVKDGVQWTTERKSTPGQLKFSLLKSTVPFTEGDAVRLKVDDEPVFYGFIFSRKVDKGAEVQITAYDQLRYLKNKETYNYFGKTATDVVSMIAKDFNLHTGDLEASTYVIAQKNEQDKSLFDIIGNALDAELTNANNLFVLYDDFGKLALKNITSMKVGILVDGEVAENFSYESSIDKNTYNQVKVVKKNTDTGVNDVYMTKSTETINKWGILQLTEELKDSENGQAKAEALLNLYNAPSKTLKFTNILGHTGCRAGALIMAQLSAEDLEVDGWMLIEKAVHTFDHDHHHMDLTLRGGVINE